MAGFSASETGSEVEDSAIVVGGGPAGLAAAIALKKAGVKVQLFEQRESLGGGDGTLVSLFPNGVAALDSIHKSILPQLRAAGVCDPPSAIVIPTTLELMGPWSSGPSLEEKFGYPMVTIRWSIMLGILAGVLQQQEEEEEGQEARHEGAVVLRTGLRLVEVQQDSGSVCATFVNESGETEQATAAFLVGTDGIRSRVREFVLSPLCETNEHAPKLAHTAAADATSASDASETCGNGASTVTISRSCSSSSKTNRFSPTDPFVAHGSHSLEPQVVVTPRDNGRTMYRAIIPFSSVDHPLLTPGRVLLSIDRSGRTAVVSDAGHSSLYFSFTVTDEYRAGLSESEFERSEDEQEVVHRIGRYFDGWKLVEHLVGVTPPSLIAERRVVDLPPLPTWTNGRVVLIGDAAHAVTPTLGQGANLAFEDAALLALAIKNRTVDANLSDVLKQFQDQRMDRVNRIIKQNVLSARKVLGYNAEGIENSDEFNAFVMGFRIPKL